MVAKSTKVVRLPMNNASTSTVTAANTIRLYQYNLPVLGSAASTIESSFNQAAISFGIGDSTIGVGIRTVDEDGAIKTQGGDNATDGTEDLIGVTWSGIGIGDTTLAVGYQNQDEDDSFALHWDIGNFYVNFSMLTLDAADADQTDATLGYTQSLGRKTTMYYEVNTFDADSDNSDDDYTSFMAVLKYDII